MQSNTEQSSGARQSLALSAGSERARISVSAAPGPGAAAVAAHHVTVVPSVTETALHPPPAPPGTEDGSSAQHLQIQQVSVSVGTPAPQKPTSQSAADSDAEQVIVVDVDLGAPSERQRGRTWRPDRILPPITGPLDLPSNDDQRVRRGAALPSMEAFRGAMERADRPDEISLRPITLAPMTTDSQRRPSASAGGEYEAIMSSYLRNAPLVQLNTADLEVLPVPAAPPHASPLDVSHFVNTDSSDSISTLAEKLVPPQKPDLVTLPAACVTVAPQPASEPPPAPVPIVSVLPAAAPLPPPPPVSVPAKLPPAYSQPHRIVPRPATAAAAVAKQSNRTKLVPTITDQLTDTVQAYKCALCAFLAMQRRQVAEHLLDVHHTELDRRRMTRPAKRSCPPPPPAQVVSATSQAECVVNVHGKVRVIPRTAAPSVPTQSVSAVPLVALQSVPVSQVSAVGVPVSVPPVAVSVSPVVVSALPAVSVSVSASRPLSGVVSAAGHAAAPVTAAPAAAVSDAAPQAAPATYAVVDRAAPSPEINVDSMEDSVPDGAGDERASVTNDGDGPAASAEQPATAVPPVSHSVGESRAAEPASNTAVVPWMGGSAGSGSAADDTVPVSESRHILKQVAALEPAQLQRMVEPKKRGRPKSARSIGLSALAKSAVVEKELGFFRCDVRDCGLKLRDKEKLALHQRCHVASRPGIWRCPTCAHEERNWTAMSTHLWRVHQQDCDLYHCDQCDYKTTKYSNLISQHKLIHGDERGHVCVTCSKAFKNNKQLQNHRAKHRNKEDPAFVESCRCEHCGSVYSDRRALQLHKEMVHEKRKDYQCQHCGRLFSCRSSMVLHSRLHTGKKRFNCDMCEYASSDHNTLRRHKMRHTGERPYKCSYCDYSCIQSQTYKKHVRTKHPGHAASIVFACPHCMFKTIQRSGYNRHILEHTVNERTRAPVASIPSGQNSTPPVSASTAPPPPPAAAGPSPDHQHVVRVHETPAPGQPAVPPEILLDDTDDEDDPAALPAQATGAGPVATSAPEAPATLLSPLKIASVGSVGLGTVYQLVAGEDGQPAVLPVLTPQQVAALQPAPAQQAVSGRSRDRTSSKEQTA